MSPAAKTFMQIDHLWTIANRLRGVTIENMDALKFIEIYDTPESFFYVDPPYPFDTRKSNGQLYPHDDMDDTDHRELAHVLTQIDGMAIISGYSCPLYTELYEANDWKRVDRETRINGAGTAVESLWMSPRVQSKLNTGQMSLFDK